MSPQSAESVLNKIPDKLPGNLRLITFNINGFRTLFHYHPWNELRNLNLVFESMKGDIITLQELKVAATDIKNSIGKIDGFQSFLTVPSLKKGYSGVGVYVRIPKNDEPEYIKDSLRVIKAEEGLTGQLISHDTKKPYIESDHSIGGYVDSTDLDLNEKIDSEGRCIILEFANGTVLISTYCPANSMDTEEGQEFRVNFFKILFQRIRNLVKMGKEVVLMGDINISRDLIDSADSLEAFFKAGVLQDASEDQFEIVNRAQALEFIKSSEPKTMLNSLLLDSLDAGIEDEHRVFVDVVRKIQGRKRALYTVWNTIRNSRPGNYGSRIDLILATKQLSETCKNANIWPFLMGSDHCPVFSDFDVSQLKYEKTTVEKLPRLEAKYVYKLSGGDITAMFGRGKKSASSSFTIDEQPRKIQRVDSLKSSQSSQQGHSISNFFKPIIKPVEENPIINLEVEDEPIPFELIEQMENELKEPTSTKGSRVLVSNGKFAIQSEKIPKCKHNEACILKTSKKANSKGKKFWTCAKDAGSISNHDDKSKFDCGFFQWR